MDLNFTIILGLFKLFFLLLIFVFIVWKYIVLKRDFVSVFDTAIKFFFKYFSILIILLFVTIQLGIYDAIVVNVFLILFITFDFLNTYGFREAKQKFEHITTNNVVKYVKYFEKGYFSKKRKKTSVSLFLKRQNFEVFYALIILVFLVVFTSLYYFKFDRYLFSSSWFESLAMINSKDKQQWFTSDINVEGQYAFINYLKHITNASSEIMIYISAIFQFLILVVILYWFVYKISESSVTVPVFVGLFFILGFAFLPVNINTFFQSSSINLAFLLVFPVFYYFLYPKTLLHKNWKLFLSFTFSFVAIGLIDLYVLCFVFPVFFILGFLFDLNKFFKKRLIIFGAYLFSLLIIVVTYISCAIISDEDFVVFFKKNLISVESNFYNPYIITAFDKLLFYYQAMFAVTIILLLGFGLLFKHSWKKKMILMAYCTIIYILTQIDSQWIDKDLLYRLLLLLIPIQIGIMLTTVLAFFKVIFKKKYNYSYRGVIVFCIGIIGIVCFEQEPLRIKKDKNNLLSEEILLANEEILNDYHDHAYIVVNQDELYMLSSYCRYFMNYSEFLAGSYLKKDATYAKYRKNIRYLKKHPKVVLASSILVFVYNDNYNKTKNKASLLLRIKTLKNRGRKVRKIHTSEFFEVYEIINQPNSSRTSEMIF
jgi:hypothetical protein